MVEGQDFELVEVPGDHLDWHMRFLTGPFPKTVIQYTNIRLDGKSAADIMMKFDFRVVYSPNIDLDPKDTLLQQVAGDVLFTMLVKGVEDGTLITREADANQSGTDDTEEHSNE